MRILITGVGGFIGQELAKKLKKDNNFLIGISRSFLKEDIEIDQLLIRELTSNIDLSSTLKNVDIIIHLAARVHITSKAKAQDINTFIKENVLVTQNLIKQAAALNVKRFLFLSTVGVYGNSSMKPFTEEDKLIPLNPYSKSKLMCENYIIKFCEGKKLSYTIIRSPLVYGLNAPGNLGILKKLIDLKIPLPILSLKDNKRSIISLKKLVEFIIFCIGKEESMNQVFLISDGNDVSSLEIIKLFCNLNGYKFRAFRFPRLLLKILFKLIGREDLIDKLINSFQVNINKSISLLKWYPS